MIVTSFGHINSVIIKARHLFSRGEKVQALLLLDQVLGQIINPIDQALLNIEKARIFVRTDDLLYQGEPLLVKALQLLELNHIEDQFLKVKTQVILAHIKAEINPPQYYEAIEVVRDALYLLEYVKDHDQLEKAELYSYGFYVQAIAYWQLGEFKIARQYVKIALEYINNEFEPDTYILVVLKNIQGILARNLGEYDQALKNYIKAIEVAHEHLIFERLPYIYNNLGYIFNKMGRFDLSLHWYKKAQIISEDFKDHKILGIILNNLGEHYALIGQYEIANSYFSQALAVQMSLERQLADTLYNMAILERNFGHHAEAASLFEKAIEERKKFSSKDLPEWYAQYARTLLRLSRVSEAQKAINIAHNISESKNPSAGQVLHPAIFITEGLLVQMLENSAHAQAIFLRGYTKAKESDNIVAIIEACLFAAQNFLQQYQEKGEAYTFKLAQKYLKEAYNYSKSKKLYPYKISTSLLTAAFMSAEYNFGSALGLLNTAIIEAKELEFKRELQEALRIQQQIKQVLFKLQTDHLGKMDQDQQLPYHTATLISTLSRILNINVRPYYNKNDFLFIAFKFVESGPVPFFMTPMIETNNMKRFLINFGVILNFLIGQGQNYFGGLYGPIPVSLVLSDVENLEQDQTIGKFAGKSGLIYSAVVKDSEIDEKRLEGQNYVIFTIIHPSWLDATFIGREELKALFQRYLNYNQNVSTWNENALHTLANDAIKLILQTSI